MNLPSCIQLLEAKPGYPVLHVQHRNATGTIALHGAHVMEWMPAHSDPVLYMSPQAVIEKGKPIRGGIPVCWPWFGPHADSSKPAHGFVRVMMWEFDRVRETPAGVDVVLRLADSPETRALWPFAFEARLHISMGLELEVGLEMTNTDTKPWTASGALHSYFSVGDVRQITIHGLHGTQYVESRLSPDKRPQDGPLVIDQEVDRLYASDAAVIVDDPVMQRELRIEKAGSLSTVVWNPWIEKSTRLSDLPDDAYPDFVCVETVNAGDDTVTLEPGETHLLFTRLCVRSLKELPMPDPSLSGSGMFA
ncbi:MAG: D-hexose-6-phosphate mutarotase [Verrucomicrobiaceae bacterium]|nr:D-hexose-6-phosphate mutarotase [Verrucomicrobiaceae bacterium]